MRQAGEPSTVNKGKGKGKPVQIEDEDEMEQAAEIAEQNASEQGTEGATSCQQQ